MAQDEVGTQVAQGQEVAQQVPTPPAPVAADTGVLAEQPGQSDGSADDGEPASDGLHPDSIVPPGASVNVE